MDSSRQSRVLQAQFNKAVREPNEFCKFAFKDDKTVNEWYVLLGNFDGDHDEFKGGEYLVRMVLPEKFPHEPPQFYFMTKNGLYDIEKKVCISIGEYHKDDYRAALGVAGFCNQLVSGLVGWESMGNGISILKTTADEKRHLAQVSKEQNQKNHAAIIKHVNDTFARYSAKWDKSKIPAEMQQRLGLTDQPSN